MIRMEKHQFIALLLFLSISVYLFQRDEFAQAKPEIILLAILTAAIIFYRLIANLNALDFMAYYAKDYDGPNHPAAYALFFWILFIIAALLMLF